MSVEPLFREYLARVEHDYRAGNATEHSYRPYLKALLERLAAHITATNEPKRRTDCGAPDYVITRNERSGLATIGYIEAKDIGVSLAETLRTDQLTRYRRALDNLVLTDYLEFRWFIGGEHRKTARLAVVKNGRIVLDRDQVDATEDLLISFLGQSAEPLRSPKDLAQRMARLTHMIRDLAVESFARQSASDMLTGLYDSFRQVLIPELSETDFADMFAQTLAYGLFAARSRHNNATGAFRREDAAREIPKTNPFLRRLFGAITGPDLDDEPFAGFVDDLTHLLARADMAAILADFGRRTRQEDPIVHFYETFLTAYDPKLRELRGVYYTPEPVVSYIVRSVDAILRRDFGLAEGLADGEPLPLPPPRRGEGPQGDQRDERKRSDFPLPAATGGGGRVLLLDPACGTGTFLYKVIDLIRERFAQSGNGGMWSGYVGAHLLPRLFGFELLMAPYAMAHLKLGMQLAALDMDEAQRRIWAYDFAGDERLGVYLTNTLDDAARKAEQTLGKYISDEANAAVKIKRAEPVMVVLGNPPYSGHSANKGAWITNLLRGEDLLDTQGETVKERGKGAKTGNYFEVDGQPLNERNPKWLNDDYVKFLRFAQWRIERTGHGVLAFITNHGYLDNPTFRGMRQSLMASFDEIHVLNLHGNSKKKERTPDGGKDENVFDIQQGVAIGIFIRRPGTHGATRTARVFHADLWGAREGKYATLAEADMTTTAWAEVQPHAPFYLFVPRAADLEAEYRSFKDITEIFGTGNQQADGGKRYGLGVITHNDLLFVGWSRQDVRQRVEMLASTAVPDAEILRQLPVQDSPYWNTARERDKVRQSNWSERIWPLYYRPFDWRFIYYEPSLMEIGRGGASQQVMAHARLNSHNLMLSRGYEVEAFEHVMVANGMAVHHAATRKEGCYLFPLYLYPDTSKASLWDEEHPRPNTPGGRRPNLAPAFIADCSARLGLAWAPDGRGDRETTFGPEDVFSYLYAVFHAPEYRERYAEFLKTDFPRLPLTRDVGLFRELCALGDTLVGLHLMERAAPAITRYPIPGDNVVEKVRYTEAPSPPTPSPTRGGAAGDQLDGGLNSGPPPSSGEGLGERVSGRVWINASQYFEGVPPEVWEFHVGGYQVCEKWLKDRKGRTLSYDDLAHYQQVVAALAETIRLMAAIDETIEEHGGWPLE